MPSVVVVAFLPLGLLAGKTFAKPISPSYTYTGTSPLISVSAMLSFFVGKVSLVLPTFLDHTQKVMYGIIMTFLSH